MAKQTIGIGSSADDGTGDTLRAAFDKCNDNFDELYSETLVGLTPTKGNIVVGNGTDWIAIGVGSNDQVLTADSAQSSGVKWAAAAGGASSPLELTAGSASEVPLTINGAASQSANLQQWENSSGTVIASVGSAGKVCGAELQLGVSAGYLFQNQSAVGRGLELSTVGGTNSVITLNGSFTIQGRFSSHDITLRGQNLTLNPTAKLVFSGLPTSDPASAGQIWNDGGTLKISAG